MKNRKMKLIVSLLTSTAIMFGVNTPAGAYVANQSKLLYSVPRMIPFEKKAEFAKKFVDSNDIFERSSRIVVGSNSEAIWYATGANSFLDNDQIVNIMVENHNDDDIYLSTPNYDNFYQDQPFITESLITKKDGKIFSTVPFSPFFYTPGVSPFEIPSGVSSVGNLEKYEGEYNPLRSYAQKYIASVNNPFFPLICSQGGGIAKNS